MKDTNIPYFQIETDTDSLQRGKQYLDQYISEIEFGIFEADQFFIEFWGFSESDYALGRELSIRISLAIKYLLSTISQYTFSELLELGDKYNALGVHGFHGFNRRIFAKIAMAIYTKRLEGCYQ